MKPQAEETIESKADEDLNPGQKVGLFLLGSVMFVLALFLLGDLLAALFR